MAYFTILLLLIGQSTHAYERLNPISSTSYFTYLISHFIYIYIYIYIYVCVCFVVNITSILLLKIDNKREANKGDTSHWVWFKTERHKEKMCGWA